MRNRPILSLYVVLGAMMFGFICERTHAMETIDPDNDGSQYGWSENGGWVNAEPGGDGGPGVVVELDGLSGYLWSENFGWISLSCLNTNSCGTVNFGVANDGAGNLSGFGWGENIGWVNFSPATGGRVTVDPGSGEFSGQAWGENVGWIRVRGTGTPAYGITSIGDSTPPGISPSISGTLGTNGWYISAVNISWEVMDPESPITNTMGCDPTNVTEDTPLETFMCEATSGGGTSSQSVPIRKDMTAPAVGLFSPALDAIFSVGQVVLANWTATDAIGLLPVEASAPSGTPIDTSTPGEKTFLVTATDFAGNVTSVSRMYTVAAVACDVNQDLVVDRADIGAIFAARNQPAMGPDDPRDRDGDGTITVIDGRLCVLECTNPGCVPGPPQ